MATTPRKQREVRERELRLLEVARGMLVAHGYAGLSMDRLAEATEYSKGTIYQHFSTKEDLVTALAAQTMERRVALFERVARFRGLSRERMEGFGMADEVFARLNPQSFRSELIIKMAQLDERATPERTVLLRGLEASCLSSVQGIIEAAIASGDLAATVSIPHLMLATITMVIGTHTIASNFRPILDQIRIDSPFSAMQSNIQILLDGFGWKPLSTEWDYAETHRRIAREIFADESQIAGLA